MAEKYLQMRGSTSNANWAIYPGIYTTNTSTTDAAQYGVILVLASSATAGFNGSNWIFQIWYQTNGKIKTRYSINAKDGGSWTTWRDIGTSILSGTTLTVNG